MRAAPTINLNGTSGGPGYAATYTPFTTSTPSPVPIAASTATISGVDSPSLVSMNIAIQSPPDGNSEQLQVETSLSSTGVTSSFANGVLTLFGVADAAAYQTMLESIAYSNAPRRRQPESARFRWSSATASARATPSSRRLRWNDCRISPGLAARGRLHSGRPDARLSGGAFP